MACRLVCEPGCVRTKVAFYVSVSGTKGRLKEAQSIVSSWTSFSVLTHSRYFLWLPILPSSGQSKLCVWFPMEARVLSRSIFGALGVELAIAAHFPPFRSSLESRMRRLKIPDVCWQTRLTGLLESGTITAVCDWALSLLCPWVFPG